MAKQVGTIQLSGHGELNMLAKQGQRLVGAICSILYVKRGDDVFKPGAGNGWQVGGAFPTGAPSGDSGNWVGK
jgi:hypothetical protein